MITETRTFSKSIKRLCSYYVLNILVFLDVQLSALSICNIVIQEHTRLANKIKKIYVMFDSKLTRSFCFDFITKTDDSGEVRMTVPLKYSVKKLPVTFLDVSLRQNTRVDHQSRR